MCLCNRSVESTCCPCTDHLKQEDYTITRLLGNSQIHILPRLSCHLNNRISNPINEYKKGYLAFKDKDIFHKLLWCTFIRSYSDLQLLSLMLG